MPFPHRLSIKNAYHTDCLIVQLYDMHFFVSIGKVNRGSPIQYVNKKEGECKQMIEINDLQALNAHNKRGMDLVLCENIVLTEPLLLQPDVTLRGKNRSITISGENHLIGLIQNNSIEDITLETAKDKDALFFHEKDVNGAFYLKNITTHGAITLSTSHATGDIDVKIDNIHIVEADVTHKEEGPEGYGVTVIQGALTVWNQTPGIRFTTEITGVSIGEEETPVNGSGVFVSGTKEAPIYSKKIETKDVYTNGLLTQGTSDRISGGVFVVTNAHVDRVENHGTTKTFGFNDMVLDNWGDVEEWVVKGSVLSEGTSAIGFVNFGTIHTLRIEAPIQTKGTGARGINNYDGSIKHLELDQIETKGDGAIGIQVSKPMGTIQVYKDIITYGGTGESLVKGEIKQLSAIGISILDGAEVQRIEVKGNIYTYGKDIDPIQNEGKVIDGFHVRGEAMNKNSV